VACAKSSDRSSIRYTKPLDGKRRTVAIARGRFDGHALSEVRDIFVADAAGTSRIAFGRDGTLFMTTTGNNPQDPNTQGGKVLRFKRRWHDSERQPVCRTRRQQA